MWSRRAIQAISALLTLSACATADQDNAISTYVSTQATSLGGGKYDLRIGPAFVEKMRYNLDRPYKHKKAY